MRLNMDKTPAVAAALKCSELLVFHQQLWGGEGDTTFRNHQAVEEALQQGIPMGLGSGFGSFCPNLHTPRTIFLLKA